MITSLLLDASDVPAAIVEALPLVLATIVLGPILYLGLIVLFIRGKSLVWRLPGLAIASLVAFEGVRELQGYGNELGILNSLFFIPILVGVVTEYFLYKKRPVA